MNPADLILSVAERLWGLKTAFSELRRDRRDRVAEYFAAVSACLEQVTATLRAGEIPHGKCGEMQVYARSLAQTIGDVVGREEARELAGMLGKAHDVEWMVVDLGPHSPEREERLGKMEQASGMFSGLAVSMRAAK